MEGTQIQNIIYFSGSAIIFLLGYYVFLKDPKRSLNKIFFIFSLAAVSWGLTAGLLRTIYLNYPSQRGELIKEIWMATEIFLLEDIGLLGAYSLSSLFLHLCLVILEKREILKRKIFYFSIYLPPFLMFLVALANDFYFTLRKIEFPKSAMSFLDIFSILYFEAFLFIALLLLFRKFFSLKSFQEKAKLIFLLFGALIPAISGSVLSLFLPVFFNIRMFGWTTFPLYALGYFFVSIGILRYGLFVDYREILESIFEGLTELVIVADKEGLVLLTNEITLLKLGFKDEEFIGKDIKEFLREKREWKEILDKIRKGMGSYEEKLSFLTKEGKEIPFLLAASQTKEGIILVGKDIGELVEYQERLEKEVKERTRKLEETKDVLEIKVAARTRELRELAQSLEEQVKSRTKELQKKIEELEKFHRLAVGRELKMVELKKEVEKLKKELQGT